MFKLLEEPRYGELCKCEREESNNSFWQRAATVRTKCLAGAILMVVRQSLLNEKKLALLQQQHA
jgi:hypothetical protein